MSPSGIGDRFTGEVDDGIGSFETLLPNSRLSAIPLDCRYDRP
jgi:hypothetical protein